MYIAKQTHDQSRFELKKIAFMTKDKIAEFLTKTECKNARICKTYCTAQQWMFTYILFVESARNLAKK